MAQTYSQIIKQIEGLQAQAEKLRRTEVEGVIARIRTAIEAYSLTPADLGFNADANAGGSPKAPAAKSGSNGGNNSNDGIGIGSDGAPAPIKRRRRRRGAGKAAAKPVRVVKFSNGEGGTWGGLGKRPQWLRDELAKGRNLNDFLVK